MTPQEVRAGLRCLTATDRKLMVGVLVSHTTLRGQENRYPNRYPKTGNISEIFLPLERVALNLIHYHTNETESLSIHLQRIVKASGPNIHGVQLNIAWPSLRELWKFHEATDWKKRIVLQVGSRAMEAVDNDPVKLADMIGKYVEPQTIDDVLIDPSGGNGLPFDTEKALEFLRELKSRNFDINLGVAGGLGPDSMKHLEPLLDEFPDVNIDAEGRLRDTESDDLDIVKMTAYLTEAQVWFNSYSS